jgi:hypothetical protein
MGHKIHCDKVVRHASVPKYACKLQRGDRLLGLPSGTRDAGRPAAHIGILMICTLERAGLLYQQ